MPATEDTTTLELALALGDEHQALAQRLKQLTGSENLAAKLSAIHEAEAMLALQAEARRNAAAQRMVAVPEAPPQEAPAEQDDDGEEPQPEPEPEPAEPEGSEENDGPAE